MAMAHYRIPRRGCVNGHVGKARARRAAAAAGVRAGERASASTHWTAAARQTNIRALTVVLGCLRWVLQASGSRRSPGSVVTAGGPVEITDIRITRNAVAGKLLAYVSATFDHCFVVHNIKIILGRGGPFVAMPSRKTQSGRYRDIAHPITATFREVLQTRILADYQRSEESGDAGPEPGAED